MFNLNLSYNNANRNKVLFDLLRIGMYNKRNNIAIRDNYFVIKLRIEIKRERSLLKNDKGKNF